MESGKERKMKYFVVDCITGVKSGKGYTDLDKAKERRAKLDAKSIAEGHSKGFWIIIDQDGNEIAFE